MVRHHRVAAFSAAAASRSIVSCWSSSPNPGSSAGPDGAPRLGSHGTTSTGFTAQPPRPPPRHSRLGTAAPPPASARLVRILLLVRVRVPVCFVVRIWARTPRVVARTFLPFHVRVLARTRVRTIVRIWTRALRVPPVRAVVRG